MATFNYTVDTQPMAEEMSSVSRHVNLTTGAVVTMQTAVIAAENKAADHVCKNVNKGFYSLIRSQISQKLAKLQSEVDSHLMQLVQQKNALLSIKNRMQRDYNMIAGRYIKLFNGLNANLKSRVFELDRPTTDFACKELDKITNRPKYLAATIPLTQLESVSDSQKIVVSNVKQRGQNVINSMKTFIHEMNQQKKLTDQILIHDPGSLKVGPAYIPIAICEVNRDRSENKVVDILVPEAGLTSVNKSAVINTTFARSAELNWIQSTSVLQEIVGEFKKMNSSSSKSQRIKDRTLFLFQSNNHKTI